MGEILDGERTVRGYEGIRMVVPRPDAASWHDYVAPGTLGLISAEAVDVIGQPAFRLFDLLPAKVNDYDFCLLKAREHLPCFDRENAEFETFPDETDTIMEITRYAFKEEG